MLEYVFKMVTILSYPISVQNFVNLVIVQSNNSDRFYKLLIHGNQVYIRDTSTQQLIGDL